MKLMTLSEKQQWFARMTVEDLFPWIFAQGCEFTYGEIWRPHETEVLYQKEGKSELKPNQTSIHELKMAADLNIFKNGVLLQALADYLPFGQYWEGLSNPTLGIVCCWGGRWGDADHFSFEHEGIK